MTTLTFKPTVLVVGATGNTGSSIVNGLLRSGAFKVIALSRSDSKPEVAALRARGVEIRIGDPDVDEPEKLRNSLAGVDILISAIIPGIEDSQPKLFDAAKAAGVKRVIPTDWGTSAPPGVMKMNDHKLEIREYVRKLGFSYTFVEVGWWLQITVPLPTTPLASPPIPDRRGLSLKDILNTLYGSGDVKFAVIDLHKIGDLVARILLDERTVDKVVFASETEVTLNEVWNVAAKYDADGGALLQKRSQMPAKEIETQLTAARTADDIEQSVQTRFPRVWMEYMNSIFVRGDNTFDNAVRLGALDARALYPDYKPTTLDEYVKTFYGGVKEV